MKPNLVKREASNEGIVIKICNLILPLESTTLRLRHKSQDSPCTNIRSQSNYYAVLSANLMSNYSKINRNTLQHFEIVSWHSEVRASSVYARARVRHESTSALQIFAKQD